MTILVISNGSTTPIEDMLTLHGVPFTPVPIAQAGSTITPAFLATEGASPRAKFQAVIVPDVVTDIGSTWRNNLASYEATYGIRQLAAYQYSHPLIGLEALPSTCNAPVCGSMDGVTAQVTANGLANPLGAFKYLIGPVPFDVGSYGYRTSALPADPQAGTSVLPLVTVGSAVIVGVYTSPGVETMFLTFDVNISQTHFRLLVPGIIEWLSRGTHLGLSRNFLSVHADDILNADARWSTTRNCTPGEDCPIDEPLTPAVETQSMIMMTPADVEALTAWQATRIKIDMAYNAYPSVNSEFPGSAALTTSLLGNKGNLRWINHTYNHLYFGCTQFPDPPYNCTTQPVTSWVPTATIVEDIESNIAWAQANGIDIDATELISGEHSGLADQNEGRVQPDNPEFLAALNTVTATKPRTGVTASDASKEPNLRAAGPAVTLPRYPNSLYYNVATAAELIDEYNWIYTSAADGGSGYCTLHPDVTTCIEPLTFTSATDNGFLSYIAPFEARQTLGRLLNNDPRPHFVHQSNLAENRLALTWLGQVVDGAATFPYGYKDIIDTTKSPIINPTMTQAALVLIQQASWDAAKADVTAYTKDGQVVVTNNGSSAAWVPLSAASGTTPGTTTPFGDSYMGTRSAWTNLAPGATFTVNVNLPPTPLFTIDKSADPAVTVTSTSTDADGTIASYEWNFGDGTPTSADGPQASHTYASRGEFTITLTVTDNWGGKSALSQKVTIANAQNKPVAAFNVTCKDLACTVDGSASSDPEGDTITYEWTFGDGTQAVGSKPAPHIYQVGGTYPITLVVTDSKGANSDPVAQSVTVAPARVNKAPSATFTATCIDLTCGFNASVSTDTDGSIVSYQWTFGDGTGGSGVNPLGHVFPGAGSYTVTLTVIDNEGASGTATQAVTVSAPAPAPVAAAPAAIVKATAVSKKGKLKVDVDPILKGKKYWSFKVQYQKKNGTWGQYKKTYKTVGKKETKTINFRKGNYRVVVLPKHGLASSTSVVVTLKK